MTNQHNRIKKSPCNGCRERKRKCDYDQPCARCKKSGAECIYTFMPSPKDLEYIQELEYIQQVESLQNELASMEKEMAAIRLSQPDQLDYPSPVSLKTSSIQVPEEQEDVQYKTIFHTPTYKAQVAKLDTTSWILTIDNGRMIIDTHIQSYAQLLSSMGSMLNTSIYQRETDSMPFPLYIPPHASTDDDEMTSVMRIMVWKRYGKTRYKTFVRFTPRLLHGPKDVARVIPVDGLATIAIRLISTYLHCSHYQQFAIYPPAFKRLFMQGDVLMSPAAMALSCMVCGLSCKHLLDVLPLDALTEYAKYFFERARELIADRFDSVDLETMITFTCMAMFKLKQGDRQDAGHYLILAERAYDLLKEEEEMGEDEHVLYQRFYRCVWDCRSLYDLHDIRGCERPRVSPKQLNDLLDDSQLPLVSGPEDTERETQFLRVKRYIARLRRVIKDGGQLATAQDYPTYISVFSHHVEMGLRHWYLTVLPSAYRVSLPLFDDGVDDFTFFSALEAECQASPLRLLTTMAAYTEYLVMARAYVPKEPKETELETEELILKFREIQTSVRREGVQIEDQVLDSRAHHWLKLVAKLQYFREQQHPYDDETDEVFFTRFIRALNPSRLQFDMPVTHTAIKASLNVVRLSQFMLSKEYCCYFDARWLFNAWDILIRAARFKYQQPGDPYVTMDRIQANLIVCLDLIQTFLAYSSRRTDSPILQDMQQEFNQALQ